MSEAGDTRASRRATDPRDERRSSRLLARLLALLMPLGFGSACIQLAVVPGFMPVFVAISTAIVLLGVAYVLNRLGRYRLAATITVATVVVASAFSAVSGPTDGVSIAFLLLGPLFASLLLSLRDTFFVATGNVLVLLGLGLLVPRFTWPSLVGPLSFHVITSALLVLAAWHRARLEDDRRLVLAESESRARTLLEASVDAFFVLRGRKVVEASEGAARMFATPRTRFAGTELADFFAPESRAAIERSSRDGHERPFEAFALRGVRRFPVEVVVRERPGGLSDERVVGVRDLSAAKQVEAQLRLHDRLISLGTLTAGVAHELNNPLTFMGLALERVRAAVGAADAVAAGSRIDAAQRGLDRISGIVRSLRTFSRGDEMRIGSVDVHDVIESTLEMIRLQIGETTTVHTELGADRMARANAASLAQVLTNLLLNESQAIPADAPSREIRVTTSREGLDRIVISVADNGRGIDPELLPRIFDPFFTTKAAGEGLGLGLSICHGIIASFGGDIEVESEVGRGTTFRILLPRETSSSVALPPVDA